MEFNDIVDVFTVFKKLHTANKGDDKTIFYKEIKNKKGTLTITRADGLDDVFKTELISHMSLNNYDGLLIQYDSLDGRKLYPYPLNNIKNVGVNLK